MIRWWFSRSSIVAWYLCVHIIEGRKERFRRKISSDSRGVPDSSRKDGHGGNTGRESEQVSKLELFPNICSTEIIICMRFIKIAYRMLQFRPPLYFTEPIPRCRPMHIYFVLLFSHLSICVLWDIYARWLAYPTALYTGSIRWSRLYFT